MILKYKHYILYAVTGIESVNRDEDLEILLDPPDGLRAILTRRPDGLMRNADRSMALANMILDITFGNYSGGSDTEEYIEGKIREINENRSKKHANKVFLFLVNEDEVDCAEPLHQVEKDGFIIWLSDSSNRRVRKRSEDQATALILSMVVGAGHFFGIEKLDDSVVLFREDGKPIHSYGPLEGRARAYSVTRLTPEIDVLIGEEYGFFAKDAGLQRVQRLLRSSMEYEDDRLRSFLSAWQALEILINKCFNHYHDKFFSDLGNLFPEATRYVDRLRSVMKERNRLVDKFTILSNYLSKETAIEDVNILINLNKIRNELLHGTMDNRDRLPLDELRRLTLRYLDLHLRNM